MKPRLSSLLVHSLLVLTRVLLTMGLTRVFLLTNGLNVPMTALLLAAVLTHAILDLLFATPRSGLITGCSLLLATLLALLLAPEAVMPVRSWLAEAGFQAGSAFFYLIGQGAMNASLLAFTVPAMTAIMALLVHLFTAWVYIPLLPAAGLLGMMALDAFLEIRQDLVGVAMAGAAILVLLVKRQPRPLASGSDRARPRRRHSLAALLAAVPVIAVALAVSLALSPLMPSRIGRQQQLIEGLVDDFTQMLGIPPVQSLQPDFSISFAGFYPLKNRLGGPVTLSSKPVMEVSGHNETLLLRGAIYERYDGSNWQREPRGDTFRFDNPFQADLREKVFDLDQPDPETLSRGVVQNLIEETRLLVKPLSTATSMIFTPGRPTAITPKTNDRFQVHYDDFGMLYSKYPLTQSNPYEISSRVLLTGAQLFQNSVILAQAVGLARGAPRETIYPDSYLNVPSSGPYMADGSLRKLAREITAGIENPYDKALAIRAYLIRNARYKLDVAVPPENREFVSWFLETGEGYCVYFATAETVLCRLAGVPSRYVEGFILNKPASPNGLTVITSDLAHAWTEVYVPYIGWVPVDATPGATQPSELNPNEPLPTETTEETDNPLLEPTPEPTITPVPDAESPAEAEARQRRNAIYSMMPLLALAVLFGLEVKRRSHLLRFPQRLREDYPDPRQRAEIYWQEIQIMLSEEQLRLANGETPITFLKRAARRHTGSEDRFTEAGRLVSRIRYGRYLPKETDLAFLAGILAHLDEEFQTLRRVRHFLFYTLYPRLHAVDGRPRLIRAHFLKLLVNRRNSPPGPRP